MHGRLNESIMERSGLGRTFIAQSIKRLEKAKLFKIWHSIGEGSCNRYYFGELKSFECIPYTLFEADLTKHEKAMLLCLKQFFVQGYHMTDLTINNFAKTLGLSYQQVYKPYKAIVAKGYIKDDVSARSGNGLIQWKGFTNKLNWNFHQVLKIPVVDVIIMCAYDEKAKRNHCGLLVA